MILSTSIFKYLSILSNLSCFPRRELFTIPAGNPIQVKVLISFWFFSIHSFICGYLTIGSTISWRMVERVDFLPHCWVTRGNFCSGEQYVALTYCARTTSTSWCCDATSRYRSPVAVRFASCEKANSSVFEPRNLEHFHRCRSQSRKKLPKMNTLIKN